MAGCVVGGALDGAAVDGDDGGVVGGGEVVTTVTGDAAVVPAPASDVVVASSSSPLHALVIDVTDTIKTANRTSPDRRRTTTRAQ